MKGALDRTKVVLRHLPPTISEAALLDQIDGTFAGRYNWFSFRPGKISQKHMSYSRAYVDFKKPEDVIEFAEFFNGHIFVNEKGAQFKVMVEYAPSQRVPRQWSKKDGRDGSIYKDSEYLEFLELLAKPVENLPSAEIQLEKREAERSGAAKDNPVITPLMDFVRQKRAAKGPRRSLSNGKVSRRAGTSSNGSSCSASSRRGSGKKRISTTMYVARDTGKGSTGNDKTIYTLVPRQGDQHHSSKTSTVASSDANQTLDENGVAGNTGSGKKVLLLKGKEREIINGPDLDSLLEQNNVTSSAKTIVGSAPLKQNQRHEGSARIIRSILSNKEMRQSQSARPQSEQTIPTSDLQKERQPPRPVHVQLILKGSNGTPENRIGMHDSRNSSERLEKRVRHKDRPDRCVWTNRSIGGDDSLSLSASSQVDHLEGHAESKHVTAHVRGGDVKSNASGRGSHSSENGFGKHFGRRGPTHLKDVDGYSVANEGKHHRRTSGSHGSHEKQVWVQKASSGT
ncbi:regulator of nonsense transcripts UPF3-like isoform X1 [Arachis stenosperma]|uniref:regulator of nonsense transcripts UPF3-like isoform X1 n=1 Tax=Arachis stenosperma TaxID=217475 RepID=UPI0025AC21E8|nr:regulator of nonsense transcripts UPF3-like isoform X1 [Arachis stenosperma]